ncbi:MAG TPA: hypothetical protein VJU78_04470 [Chitinophagaceae bacterium]|nr:hypothetical protein [Chitinophagaceae bacterium]
MIRFSLGNIGAAAVDHHGKLSDQRQAIRLKKTSEGSSGGQ